MVEGVSDNLDFLSVKFCTIGLDKYLLNSHVHDSLLSDLDWCNKISCNSISIENIGSSNISNYCSIVLFNVQCLAAHIDELEITTNSIGTPFVIWLCEMWLILENQHLYSIPGYSIVSLLRMGRSGGGMVILVSENLRHQIRTDLQSSQERVVESIFVEIEQDQNSYLIGKLYGPPDGHWSKFADYLTGLLEKLANTGQKVYLLGDFKVDLLQFPSTNHSNKIICALALYYVSTNGEQTDKSNKQHDDLH